MQGGLGVVGPEVVDPPDRVAPETGRIILGDRAVVDLRANVQDVAPETSEKVSDRGGPRATPPSSTPR